MSRLKNISPLSWWLKNGYRNPPEARYRLSRSGLVGRGYGKALSFRELLEGNLLHQLITNPLLSFWSGEGYLSVAGFGLPFGIRAAAFALALGLALPGELCATFNFSIEARKGAGSQSWK